MTRRIQILAGITLLLCSHGLALGADKEPGSFVPFAVASVRFEQNATDGDAEVVFEAQASALKGGMTAEMAQEQFRQIALALRIRRKNEEYEALKQKVSSNPTSRELMTELDRRMRELAELRAQRL